MALPGVAGLEVEVLSGQLQAQVAGEAAGADPVAARVQWFAPVVLGVDDGRGELAVVGPGSAVHVVAADAGPMRRR